MKKTWNRAISAVLSAAIAAPAATAALAGCSLSQTEDGVGFATVKQVELLDAYAENGLQKEIEYLLKIDPERLLADFRDNAWIDTDAKPYGGQWEGSLIGGHTMGHYLSALARASVNAGAAKEQQRQLGERLDSIVSALKACQQNAEKAGAEKGFLWGARMIGADPEFQFDNVENGKTNIQTQAWVPWYTLHKILAGLIDVYRFTGNDTAKEVASELGNWVYRRVSAWTEEVRARVLSVEYGGMNDALYELYAVTGEEKFAVAAHKFDEDIATPGRTTSLFEDILSGRRDYLDGRHANTTIPKIIGALNRYIRLHGKTVAGEKVDASDMLEVAEKFFDRVSTEHTYVTGGNSEWEHFGRDGILDAERTRANCETCNAYNMLKLSRMLYSVTGEKKYLDFYENTYLNDIWASQDPASGMTTYWQPMATGYFKVYSTEFDSFWCCTGSGMESFSKLNDSIYFLNGSETVVSLYLASVLDTGSLRLAMSADLENSDTVTIKVERGATDLRLRIPDWTAAFSVMVGGKEVNSSTDDGFFAVSVKEGDEVTVTLKKTLTAHSLPDDPKVYAFKYGPYVLAAELGTAQMTTSTDGVNVTVPRDKDLGGFSETVHLTGTAEAFMKDLSLHLIRGQDGKFRLEGTDQALVFSYFFRQSTQRYGIYFTYLGSGEEAEETDAYQTVDTVQPGYGQYETDDWHAMEEQDSVGSTADSALATSRYAEAGGFFQYRMAVKKGEKNYLTCTFAAEDAGKTIAVYAVVNGKKTTLFTKTLTESGMKAYDVTIALPREIVDAASSVTLGGETRDLVLIRIESADGSASARIGGYLRTVTEIRK